MPINGVIPAIGEHIAACNALSCGNKSVRADKSPELRAIIPAVEVIKPRLGIVVVTPVAEGVFVAHGVAGGVGDGAFAPGVVAVLSHDLSRCGAGDGDDVPLQVIEVVVQGVAVEETHTLAGAVVEEPHNAVPGLLRQNLAAVEEEFLGGAVHRFGCSDAVMIISRNLS